MVDANGARRVEHMGRKCHGLEDGLLASVMLGKKQTRPLGKNQTAAAAPLALERSWSAVPTSTDRDAYAVARAQPIWAGPASVVEAVPNRASLWAVTEMAKSC